MKRGVFNRIKLLVVVERTLCASFTIKLADPSFRNVRRRKNSGGRPLDPLWLVDVVNTGIGNHDRETSTQNAFGPDEQLCCMKEPTFDCKAFLRYDCLYDFFMHAV
ncbi:predicted protein [Lichtheimia corymbifera JMRC:FSU:9682]|uniref:Uncharacterized protein n=1 Tax=Lichtheimia corymbifera JMRC:FSU:9682 TaxID=1263082 RepID=A0A068RNB3_9FUNG|nr:predicted protein [Lichtheimia corymbifera JMRC:FSU:9682]